MSGMQFENSLIQGVQRSWRDAFSIDLRSLALFRMGLAATLLYNLATRSRDLVAMYTDSGYLPVATWRATVDVSFWSLHGLRGETTFIVLLFLLHAVAGVALLVGYRARLASCLAWLLLVSLHHRNPLLLSGGDVLLGMLLFLDLALALGVAARFAFFIAATLELRRSGLSQVVAVSVGIFGG